MSNNKVVFTKQRPRFLQNVPERGARETSGSDRKRTRETRDVVDLEEEFVRNAPVVAVDAPRGKTGNGDETRREKTPLTENNNEEKRGASEAAKGEVAETSSASTARQTASSSKKPAVRAEVVHNNKTSMLSFAVDEEDDDE